VLLYVGQTGGHSIGIRQIHIDATTAEELEGASGGVDSDPLFLFLFRPFPVHPYYTALFHHKML